MVVVHEGGELRCTTRNVSLGGMYLLTETPLPYGTRVRVRFHLAALRETAEIEATVRWGGEDGMGVQFGSLRAREVWGLNQIFKDGTPSAS